MTILEARGLAKQFGEFKALKGIDFATSEGEFLTIVGPSGCGKTTLMRLIAGLEKPTRGDVLLDGRTITRLPPRARNIAMVFQSYALYPHMSVADNIAFPLRARRVGKAERERLVHWAAGVLGIEPLLQRRPARLSGGEKQKVALARAIVRQPSLFIFDEPLSSLDAQVRAVARAELRQLHDRTGVTTVYVTHDQTEALGLGDRVAVMQAGALRQLGSPQQLYDEPASTFVAGFIGTPPMNLLPYDDVLIGFRPEHALPRAAALSPGHTVTLHILVERTEFLGSEWLVYGKIDTASGAVKVLCKLQHDTVAKVEVKTRQEFVVSTDSLHFFDKVTTLRRAPVPVHAIGSPMSCVTAAGGKTGLHDEHRNT